MKRYGSRDGYIMAAFMFLIGIAVPSFIALSYFNLSNQTKNIQYQMRDIQLKWTALSTIDRIQLELRNLIDTKTLDDALFTVGSSMLDSSMSSSINTWFEHFKTDVNQSVTDAGSPMYARATQGLQDSEYIRDCGNDCRFIVATANNLDGTANFQLNVKLRLSNTQTAGQNWGISQVSKVVVSNLSSYSVFTYNDLVTSPGTDSVYEGPIYVNKDVYVTPNSGSKIRFTFNPDNFNAHTHPYSLKASGNFFWYGPRAYNPPDPYNPLDGSNYERDPYGAPVLYYYTSNNNPGWLDLNMNGVNSDDGKSTIEVLSNFSDPANLQYVNLIGTNRPVPMVTPGLDANASRPFNFKRGDSEISWRYSWAISNAYKTTNLHTWSTVLSQGGAVVTPSTTLDANSATPYPASTNNVPKNPNWNQNFFDTNFLAHDANSSSFYTFKDQVPVQSLRLGGASNPHVLIEPALHDDQDSLKKVKVEWLARNAVNPAQTDLNFQGIAIDFRQLFCASFSRADCTHTSSSDDPEFWMRYKGPNNDKPAMMQFVNLDAASQNAFNSSITRYYDQRMQKYLNVISINVGRLSEIVRNHEPVAGANHNQAIPSNKPLVLYIGLPSQDNGQTCFTNPCIMFGIPTIYNAVIRLVNAQNIPDQGLTIVSNGFIQIAGDFNRSDKFPGSNATCNNIKPAAIIGDQLMIVSKSWQDWSQGTIPNTYQDPYDLNTYPSPTFISGGTPTKYPITDYHSHPIRCFSQVDGDCGDVTINAVLIGGDIPNQLKRFADEYGFKSGMNSFFYSDYIVSNTFYGGLPGPGTNSQGRLWSNPPNSRDNPNINVSDPDQAAGANIFAMTRGNPNYDGSGGAYLRKKFMKRQNAVYDSSDAVNKGDAFATVPALQNYAATHPQTQLTDQQYNDLPVYLVSYDPVSDSPIYSASIGTVGTLFDSTHCPSCNGDIPLFLKVDENGNILHGDLTGHSMETDHIKADHTGGATDNLKEMGSLYKGESGNGASYIKPGERFAALANYDENSNPLLVPELSFTHTCNFYQPGTNNLCTPNNVTGDCNARPDLCGTWCPTCPGNSCTVSGGEQTCGNSPQCNPSNCQTIDTNHCEQRCTDTAASIQKAIPADPGTGIPIRKIVYTVGGTLRLMLRNSVNRFLFQYIPYSIPMYSGGFENFIRLSENWSKWNCGVPSGNIFSSCAETATPNNLTITGALDILWSSQTLVDSNQKPAFWTQTAYTAPKRTFKYAGQLKDDQCKPPGLPVTIQMGMERFKQE